MTEFTDDDRKRLVRIESKLVRLAQILGVDKDDLGQLSAPPKDYPATTSQKHGESTPTRFRYLRRRFSHNGG